MIFPTQSLPQQLSERGIDSPMLLRPGMYVRVPHSELGTLSSSASRRFVLAQITAVRNKSEVDVTIWSNVASATQPSTKRGVPVEVVSRTLLAEGAPFRHYLNGEINSVIGRIAFPQRLDLQPGQFQHYYVETDGRVQLLSEHELVVGDNCAAPDCLQQVRDYEFYPPDETLCRQQLLAHQAKINAATHGIAELLGARVQLLVHQAEVVQRVLNSNTCRFMLADEVGLGKTIEAGLIVQGLRRRDGFRHVLVITPAPLVRQWQRELKAKFRLNFQLIPGSNLYSAESKLQTQGDGFLVSYEELAEKAQLQKWVERQPWQLLVMDEAHNLRHKPSLYNYLQRLSEATARVLVLTATPVERRAEEYLQLLRMLDPQHYKRVTVPQFEAMVAANKELRSTIAYLERGLDDPDSFSIQEFQRDIQNVMAKLPEDKTLADLVALVDSKEHDGGIASARSALTYLKDNYRLDSRVFRNRRATLEGVKLPTRGLTLEYAYTPSLFEKRTLEALHDYADASLAATQTTALQIEGVRTLFHAAASSAEALLALLSLRRARLQANPAVNDSRLTSAVSAQITKLPAFADESRLLARIEAAAREWRNKTAKELSVAASRRWAGIETNRLVQVLRCARDRSKEGKKVLIFSSWRPTLDLLYNALKDYDLTQMEQGSLQRIKHGADAIAEFHSGLDAATLDSEATWFQNNPICKVLLLDETGGEGRNFQISDSIIHVDLPWTPALLEQRIGRVDRIGRGGIVKSYVPVAKETIEEDLLHLWQDGFKLFTQSMSGMEIVLEDVQVDVAKAFAADTRSGLRDLLPDMVQRAAELREEIEEERYQGEARINWQRRREFEDFSSDYGDGDWLKDVLQRTFKQASYNVEMRPHAHILLAAKHPMKLKEIPDFPEERSATTQDPSQKNPLIRGTLHRATAVAHESIEFFAPGDAWVDKTLINTLQSDARACAIFRSAPQLEGHSGVLALTYRAVLDPRPLLQEGYAMHHLLRAHGYLPTFVKTVYVVIPKMKVLDPHDRRNAPYLTPILDAPQGGDKDLGSPQYIGLLKKGRQPEEWYAWIESADRCAIEYLKRHSTPTEQDIAQAKGDLLPALDGERAALRWLYGDDGDSQQKRIQQAEQITHFLLEALNTPLWFPESATFWYLQGKKRD